MKLSKYSADEREAILGAIKVMKALVSFLSSIGVLGRPGLTKAVLRGSLFLLEADSTLLDSNDPFVRESLYEFLAQEFRQDQGPK